MKLDRLVSIITVLLRRDRVSAKELSELFEVSVRTILRDVEAINLAGIPIVTWQGAGGGIGIAEGFRLDRSVLTQDDMASLITALKGAASTLNDPKLNILLEKLRNSVPRSHADAVNLKSSHIVIDLTPWGGGERLTRDLGVLRQAIEGQQEISFEYLDAGGRRTLRTAQPYTLVLRGLNWYLYGWCALRQAFRLFRVSRIKELVLLESRFQREEAMPPIPELEKDSAAQGEPAALLLAFDPSAETAAAEWFGEEAIERQDDRLIVRAAWPENGWLYGFLLGFGPALTVLEPKHIRELVAEMARKTAEKYSKK